MFNLRKSDLPELERLAEIGAEWIARDAGDDAYAYKGKPQKSKCGLFWSAICFFGSASIRPDLLSHTDIEPLNIAEAIAQIAADEKLPTYNEYINQMTIEEKAHLFVLFAPYVNYDNDEEGEEIEVYRSTLIPDKDFYTQEEAVAATVKKLKRIRMVD